MIWARFRLFRGLFGSGNGRSRRVDNLGVVLLDDVWTAGIYACAGFSDWLGVLEILELTLTGTSMVAFGLKVRRN